MAADTDNGFETRSPSTRTHIDTQAGSFQAEPPHQTIFGRADEVGVLGRRGAGEGGGVEVALVEEELHQRHPLRPRVGDVRGGRSPPPS